jgi:hypothetical protein
LAENSLMISRARARARALRRALTENIEEFRPLDRVRARIEETNEPLLADHNEQVYEGRARARTAVGRPVPTKPWPWIRFPCRRLGLHRLERAQAPIRLRSADGHRPHSSARRLGHWHRSRRLGHDAHRSPHRTPARGAPHQQVRAAPLSPPRLRARVRAARAGGGAHFSQVKGASLAKQLGG